MTARECSIPACGRNSAPGRRGWCGMHYQRWYKYGDPLEIKQRRGVCSIAECDTKHFARGWCYLHYCYWRNYGSAEHTPGRIYGNDLKRLMSKVEVAENGCWLWVGTMHSHTGYGIINYQGRNIGAHRLAFILLRGEIPAGLDLDHVCHSNDLTCVGGTCIHRRCVNPDHLEPVTRLVNVRRGRHVTKVNA